MPEAIPPNVASDSELEPTVHMNEAMEEKWEPDLEISPQSNTSKTSSRSRRSKRSRDQEAAVAKSQPLVSSELRLAPTYDGSIFSCIEYLLFNQDANTVGANIRQFICSQVLEKATMDGKKGKELKLVQEYVSQLADLSFKGGPNELEYLSSNFNTEVVVIELDSEAPRRFGYEMNYPQRILVYLSRDQHFNSIVATDNKGAVVQRVFSSLDSSLFDRARILMNLMRNDENARIKRLEQLRLKEELKRVLSIAFGFTCVTVAVFAIMQLSGSHLISF